MKTTYLVMVHFKNKKPILMLPTFSIKREAEIYASGYRDADSRSIVSVEEIEIGE